MEASREIYREGIREFCGAERVGRRKLLSEVRDSGEGIPLCIDCAVFRWHKLPLSCRSMRDGTLKRMLFVTWLTMVVNAKNCLNYNSSHIQATVANVAISEDASRHERHHEGGH